MTDPDTQARQLELAAQELGEIGVEVELPPPERNYAAFEFTTCSNGQVFADRSGKHFREEFIDGRFVNPMGIRQDVHEVLRKHRLATEWWDETTITVCSGPDAAGWTHGYKLYISEYDEKGRRVVVRLPTDERAAILAGQMSEDEGIERIGRPKGSGARMGREGQCVRGSMGRSEPLEVGSRRCSRGDGRARFRAAG